MRQCRFCGHINDDALIYCISCDSPMDPTMQSRIPEELRKAIEHNKRASQSPSEPATPAVDASASMYTGQEVAGQVHRPSSSTSHLFEVAKPFTDPGQSYEMTSVPVIHQSGEIPFYTGAREDNQALDPTVPTRVEAQPKPPAEAQPGVPTNGTPYPFPGGAGNFVPQAPTAPLPSYQPETAPLNPFQPPPPGQAMPAVPVPPPQKPPQPQEYGFPPQPADLPETKALRSPRALQSESRPDMPHQSYELEEQHAESLSGGWRVLSSLLMILLMLVSGGFMAVFVYMYLFAGSDNMSNKASPEKWRPMSTSPRQRPRIRPTPRQQRSTTAEQRIRQVMQKARQDLNQRNWSGASQKLALVLAAEEGTSFHPEARKLQQQITVERQSQQALSQAQRLAQRRRWRQASLQLQKITPGTHAASRAARVRRLVERKYLRRQVRKVRRYSRRRRYKQAFRLLASVLKTSPQYTPARRQFRSISHYVTKRQSRCQRSCKRRYRRRSRRSRRNRKRCLARCLRRYPTPPSLFTPAPQPRLAAATAAQPPQRTTTPSPTRSQRCRRKCRRDQRRLSACQRRYLRRYRYWCRRRCRRLKRYRRSRSRQRRCLQSCRQYQYTSLLRRRCRYAQRRYDRCLKRCR